MCVQLYNKRHDRIITLLLLLLRPVRRRLACEINLGNLSRRERDRASCCTRIKRPTATGRLVETLTPGNPLRSPGTSFRLRCSYSCSHGCCYVLILLWRGIKSITIIRSVVIVVVCSGSGVFLRDRSYLDVVSLSRPPRLRTHPHALTCLRFRLCTQNRNVVLPWARPFLLKATTTAPRAE